MWDVVRLKPGRTEPINIQKPSSIPQGRYATVGIRTRMACFGPMARNLTPQAKEVMEFQFIPESLEGLGFRGL